MLACHMCAEFCWTSFGFKEHGFRKRRTSTGWLITIKTDKNAELVEELICWQEDFSATHKGPREIAGNVGISRTLVRGLVKRRKINQFKRMKTPHMNNGIRDWRTIWSGDLAERSDCNLRLVEKFAYQDEKDFTVEVLTNIQNKRKKGPGTRRELFPSSKVFAFLTWNGATKPFFVDGCEVKIMQRHTSDIYRKKFYLSFNAFIYIKVEFLCTSQCTITPFKPRRRFFTRITQFTFYQNTWMTSFTKW